MGPNRRPEFMRPLGVNREREGHVALTAPRGQWHVTMGLVMCEDRGAVTATLRESGQGRATCPVDAAAAPPRAWGSDGGEGTSH